MNARPPSWPTILATGSHVPVGIFPSLVAIVGKALPHRYGEPT
jgi:hypothetical protein